MAISPFSANLIMKAPTRRGTDELPPVEAASPEATKPEAAKPGAIAGDASSVEGSAERTVPEAPDLDAVEIPMESLGDLVSNGNTQGQVKGKQVGRG